MGGHASKLFPGIIDSSQSKETISDSSKNGLEVLVNKEEQTSPKHVMSRREHLLEEATSDVVKKIVKELYRSNATVGDGGTADAIRKQLSTGELIGGKDHIQKGRERLKQIQKILSRNPNHPDKLLLEQLRDDLMAALRGV